MKKILLTAAASTILASSAAMAGAEDIFYLKANFGVDYLQKQNDNSTKLKVESKNNYFIGVGAGYTLMDNVRVDLMFDHYIDPELTKTGKVAGESNDITSKHQGEINSLMLNGYVELFDISITKVFLGAGVGMAQVKEKVIRSGGAPSNNFSVTSKKNNNFAYALHLGATTELSPGVHGELTYSWRDFGKTKSVTAKGTDVGSTDYRGHHLSLGARFDI